MKVFLKGCASMQKRRELRMYDKGKQIEGKKIDVRPTNAGSPFFCPRSFCLFFDFPRISTTTVNRRRLKPELQHEISLVRLPAAHVTR
jgi:hypothetical protein